MSSPFTRCWSPTHPGTCARTSTWTTWMNENVYPVSCSSSNVWLPVPGGVRSPYCGPAPSTPPSLSQRTFNHLHAMSGAVAYTHVCPCRQEWTTMYTISARTQHSGPATRVHRPFKYTYVVCWNRRISFSWYSVWFREFKTRFDVNQLAKNGRAFI